MSFEEKIAKLENEGVDVDEVRSEEGEIWVVYFSDPDLRYDSQYAFLDEEGKDNRAIAVDLALSLLEKRFDVDGIYVHE